VELEDEADRRGPVLGRVQAVELAPVDLDRAAVRPFERADQVEQRALARPGRTGECDQLARLDA
jgi:hypothetical protein